MELVIFTEKRKCFILGYDSEKIWIEARGDNALCVRATKNIRIDTASDWALLTQPEVVCSVIISEKTDCIYNTKIPVSKENVMKISTENETVFKFYGADTGTRILADAGFEAMDYSLTRNMVPWDDGFFTNVFDPEFADYFKRAARTVTNHGVELFQCHAPCCLPNCSDPETYFEVQRHTVRAIYASGYMECPNIVAHPVLHPDFHNGQNKEKSLKVNLEHFRAFVPALKDTGVTMCIENLFWGERDKPKIANACSDAEQLIALIDTLNDMYGPHFAACLDTGHAVLAGKDPTYMLRALGKRTRVLHLHDNRGVIDDHLLPGKGFVDWDGVLKALCDVGYVGTFNMETDGYLEDFRHHLYSEEAFQKAIELLYAVGRSLGDAMKRTEFLG